MRKDLLIVRAGRNSAHKNWLADKRSFDLIVFGYEELPDELTSGADESIIITGPKVAAWRKLFDQRPELLTRYEQIAMVDDDLLCTAHDLDTVFEYGRRYKLSLWQPSLTWDSYFSYGVTLHNPQFQLRYVNYVELMCPFFSADQLRRSLPLFTLGYETVIDRLWCRLRPDGDRAYAIIDAVQIRHSRPVGINAAAQGYVRDPKRKDGNMYQTYLDRAEIETGIVFHGPVAYAGITESGKPINGRFFMAMRALVLLRGAAQRVNNRFYRPVTDHVRHILTRPIDNGPIDLDAVIARKNRLSAISGR